MSRKIIVVARSFDVNTCLSWRSRLTLIVSYIMFIRIRVKFFYAILMTLLVQIFFWRLAAWQGYLLCTRPIINISVSNQLHLIARLDSFICFSGEPINLRTLVVVAWTRATALEIGNRVLGHWIEGFLMGPTIKLVSTLIVLLQVEPELWLRLKHEVALRARKACKSVVDRHMLVQIRLLGECLAAAWMLADEGAFFSVHS